ncbi:MAG: hypothetical protein Q4P36_06770 [Bowdeniella nasicola]|nr:hypothetical protein [Bowdeniella nasicola]
MSELNVRRSPDVVLRIGPTLPAWGLVLTRALAAFAIALLWSAPTWLVVVTTLTALAATTAWTPLAALCFGALAGFLPERAGEVSPTWWATVAVIIVLTHVLFVTARVSERTALRTRVQVRALTSLAHRSVPAQLTAQALWAIGWATPLLGLQPPLAVMAIGALGILLLAAALVLALRRPH